MPTQVLCRAFYLAWAVAIRLFLAHDVHRGKSHGKEKHMSNKWNPNCGFPSPEQVERMVAAEV